MKVPSHPPEHEGQYHDIVEKDQKIAPHEAQDKSEVRQGDLLDDILRLNEHYAALTQHGGDKPPENNAGRKVWKEVVERGVEDTAEDKPHRGDHHCHADREPQGAKRRTLIALLDVMKT